MTEIQISNAAGRDYLVIELEGALLISGGPTPGVHSATVRRENGLPYLPASALKGAIREQLSRLAGEDVAGRLLGTNGVGSHGEKGSPERPGGGTSRFYVGDGELISDPRLFQSGSAYAVRTQVAIDRQRRRAADKHLYLRDTVAPSPGVVFLAEADASRLEPDERAMLANVVKAVFALGAGKSTGLGALRMKLVSAPELGRALAELKIERCTTSAALASPRPRITLPPGEDFEVNLEAVDPLCIGTDRLTGNFLRSRDYLPASTLRGALLTAGIEALAGSSAVADRSGDPAFRRDFLDAETCVRFGDGAICARGTRTPRAFPLTLYGCKSKAAEHGRVDLLLTRYLYALAAEHRHFARPELRCHKCGERLAPWRRVAGVTGQRRVLTRVGMDRTRGRSEDGKLFSLEILERDTHFRTVVRGVGEEARPLLEAALNGTIRIGHGRGQGYGRLRCAEVRALDDGEDLASRLEGFDRLARRKLEQLAGRLSLPPKELGGEDRHVAVWLLGDLMPARDQPSPEEALIAALGLEGRAEIVAGDLRVDSRGGWDALLHKPKERRPVLVAGSMALLRTPLELAELEERLDPIERRGAGDARELGFGWIRFSDPIHYPDSQP
jgi:CRISPR-associated Csx10 family RAMP protein